jgi:predicted nucleotidyltransferase
MFYRDLFSTLHQHEVEYTLIGGLAVALHGVERNTMDVDIALVLSPGNVERFLHAAQALGLTPVLPVPITTLRDTATLRDWHQHRHLQAFGLRAPGAAGVTLDVLLFPPIDPQTLYQRALALDISGTLVRVAAIDDLIALKQHAGRPLDLDDVAHLQHIKATKP